MIYINGTSGFIAGNFLKIIPNHSITPVGRRLKNHKLNEFDIFIQMASPSDKYDFEKTEETIISMLDDVYHNIDLVKKAKATFIFASSEAIYEDNNRYGAFKIAIMRYLKHTGVKYINLIIPRVYGVDRPKGLMKQIKDGIPEKDLNKIIKFIDIKEFCEILKKEIYPRPEKLYQDITFNTPHTMTIKQIKEFYKL